MTDNTLKSVLVLIPETRGYRPAAHNLTAADALNLVEQFSAENRATKILDQEKHHRNPDPTKCRPCKIAAETATEDSDDHTETVEPVAS